MSVQTDYYIPQLAKADAQISLQARTITDQRIEIARLRSALTAAKEKLAAYYEKTGGEYAGGMHYGMLMDHINEALTEQKARE